MSTTTATATGYCLKCTAQREIQNIRQITLKNGVLAMDGTCPICGTTIFKIAGG